MKALMEISLLKAKLSNYLSLKIVPVPPNIPIHSYMYICKY